ncbi:penicillin-binding protein [Acidovorax carolinensis]|uniref:Penicillin-binding protein n=1 Tax=Acidovorax carolinensis TaxID=553814 RepID=A0A240UBY9_9BURK|nr:transglycosylase domain-containing protein [Acidovorax carolinensis]ART59007.1 penicillin-binding protein [Acidovorax carolinensis]
MSFFESLPARWAALRSVLPRLVQRPERLVSLHSLAWLLAALPLALLLYAVALVPFTPGISDIRKAKTEQPAQLMSADGKLLAEYRWANREWVALDQISPHVVNALIATEDHRFYSHWGLDWRRTASSVVLTLHGDPQGGSTITQQLARNLFPEEIGRSRTLTRKLKEAITALKIEATYSKDEILETYLNTVPFLYNAYGIEMAARTYFDKSADKLNVLESATLIGMLKGTAYYNPVLNPERAKARRNTVLSQMLKRGKLEQKQFDVLQKRPLRVNFERQTEVMGPAPHFAMQLRKQLIDWADANGYNLYADGLVIRSTIDSRLQNFANQAVARQGRQLQDVADKAWARRDGWGPGNALVQTLVRESAEYRAALDKGTPPDEALHSLLADATFMHKLRLEKTRVQAGFLAQNPVNGHVLAWVGSRDFGIDPYDHVAAARRQPGSTFKPFVYGAAFAQGASPTDALMDSAVEIPLGGGRVWRPTDGRAPSDEPMTLADGLAYSKNTITAQVMQQVGPARVADVARALGVRQSPLEEVPSLALGTSPVTLKEMITAYSSIVNLGRYVEPVLITRIEDKSGKVLATFAQSTPEPVFDARAAQTLRNTMRGAVDRGTATAIRSRYGIQADVAGKTGTTQDNTDGWFILMNARVVAGAWAGFNDGRITLRSDYWGQGARSALPMVGEFMQQGLRAKVINGNERFVDEFDVQPPADISLGSMRDWIRGLFGGGGSPSAPPARPPGTLPPVTTDDAPPLPAAPMTSPRPLVPLTPAMPAQEWGGG